jgi:predicted DNA-binding transcriptional regulator YafY
VNRIDRLVAILIHLQGRRVTRAEEIAEEFATSVRTVYRDIAALAEAGVPIVGEAGVGYSIVRGYHLPPVHFTTEEATALITANMLMERFADGSLRPFMTSALAKIRAVLPPDRQDHLARLEGRMSLSADTKVLPTASLFLIQKALADRRVLRMSYRGSGAAESFMRDVEPLGLTYYGDRWHLIAWCRVRRDYRDFRTDRIQTLTELSDQFGPHPDFSLLDFLRQWEQPQVRLKGKIRCNAVTAEKFRKEAQLTILAEERVAEDVTFTVEGQKWEWYISWLLSFGDRVTVIDSPELRALLLAAAEATAAHHREDGAISSQ